MLVFGGSTDLEVAGVKRSKICLRSIWAFDTNTCTWEELQVSGADLMGRQSMAVAVWEDKLYVQGGYTMHKVITDELWVLDLEEMRWARIEVVTQQNLKRANHSLNIHTLPDGRLVLLLFGGIDSHNYPANKLLMLTQKQPQLFKAQLVPNRGAELEPMARQEHCAVLWQNRYLLIYAGRNDFIQGVIGINDLVAYDLFELKWASFRAYGYHPSPRWAASLLVFNQELVLFGGTQLKGFAPNELFRMSLGEQKAVLGELMMEKSRVSQFYQSLKSQKPLTQ